MSRRNALRTLLGVLALFAIVLIIRSVVIKNDTAKSAPLPKITVQNQKIEPVINVATTFMVNWLNHPQTGDEKGRAAWLKILREYATPNYFGQLETVDPGRVPNASLNGQAMERDIVSDNTGKVNTAVLSFQLSNNSTLLVTVISSPGGPGYAVDNVEQDNNGGTGDV